VILLPLCRVQIDRSEEFMASETPCPYSKRAIAYLIDVLFSWVPGIIGLMVGLVMLFNGNTRVLGVLLIIASPIWCVGSAIWNEIFRQSKTGQTIGKSQQNIKIVQEANGQPPSLGTMFIRVFVAYFLNMISGGLFYLVDLLFPAFDSRKQRIMDKICSTIVVEVQTTEFMTKTMSGSMWDKPSIAPSSDPFK
jgi:uncharacterized RDD family membrane protein YckC